MAPGDAVQGLRPAHPLRRAAALAVDIVLLGWLFAWLLLPLPGLPSWTVLLLAGAYAVAGEGSRGQTIGKKALALEVTGARAEPAGVRRAALRYLVRAAPAVPLAVVAALAPALVPAASALALAGVAADAAWALPNPLGRTLHDLAAGTVVLHRPRQPLFRLDGNDPWVRGGDAGQ